jgi:hypothetical protein
MATKITAYVEGGMPSDGQVLGVKSAVLDCALDNAAINDIYNMFEIGPDEQPVAAGYEVLTADAGGGAIEIGIDGAAAMGSEADISAVIGATIADAIPAIEAGTVTVQVITAAATTLKVRVWVVIANVRDIAAVTGLSAIL